MHVSFDIPKTLMSDNDQVGINEGEDNGTTRVFGIITKIVVPEDNCFLTSLSNDIVTTGNMTEE